MSDLSLQGSDTALSRAARRLADETIGNFNGFNTGLCQFKAGQPATLPSSGSRREELLLDLGILSHAPGGIRLNVKIMDGAVRWAW
jgi:hypothetical protein